MSPIRTDFYLLSHDDNNSVLTMVARLLEKIHQQKIETWIWCPSPIYLETLDAFIWSYKDSSFIPHAPSDLNIKPAPLIQLSLEYPLNCSATLLINLTEQCVGHTTEHLARIIEIVPCDESAKSISREHYRFYRQQGYALFTHTLA